MEPLIKSHEVLIKFHMIPRLYSAYPATVGLTLRYNPEKQY